MAAKVSNPKPTKPSASASESVETFLAALDHPLKPVILALRQIILNADSSIAEGIKWNVPSFRTTEYFATFHLRAKDSVQIILHLGAKVRDSATTGIAIADPDSLLEWLAKDRALLKFADLPAVEANQAAFEKIIRQWIGVV